MAEKPSAGELLRQELNNLKAALDDALRDSSGYGEDDAQGETKKQDRKEEEK